MITRYDCAAALAGGVLTIAGMAVAVPAATAGTVSRHTSPHVPVSGSRPATLNGTTPAVAHLRSRGDWGYTQEFQAITLPAPPLVSALRLTCFSAKGCSADKGMEFEAGDSAGQAVTFAGTSAKTEALVDSWGKTVGTCVTTPAPSGAVTCRLGIAYVNVPDHGWLASKTSVRFAKFVEPHPGEPLAYFSWSDAPDEVNPGNNPDNDVTQIVTSPAPNQVETYIDPTATAFAAGQSAQSEEAGIICTSEGFCWAPVGTEFVSTLSHAGVYFPNAAPSWEMEYGLDVAFSCHFYDAKGYSGPGSDVAACTLVDKAIIDHYGEATLSLPVKAAAAAYPQRHPYGLVIRPGTKMGGSAIGTNLTIVAPIRITTASLPPATTSASYSATLAASGGVPTIKGPFQPPVLRHIWSLSAGTLPPGLTLDHGVISGTPTKSGAYLFTLAVTDGHGDTVSRVFTLTVGG